MNDTEPTALQQLRNAVEMLSEELDRIEIDTATIDDALSEAKRASGFSPSDREDLIELSVAASSLHERAVSIHAQQPKTLLRVLTVSRGVRNQVADALRSVDASRPVSASS